MLNATEQRKRWSDAELMALPRDGRKYELLENGLLMSPVSITHSVVCVQLLLLLSAYARRHRLGQVFDSSIGVRLSPETVLSPDVSFMSRSALKSSLQSPDKFLNRVPELVVEVLSPTDRRRVVDHKIALYLAHGARLAWLIDPRRQEVIVRTAATEQKLIGLNSVLTGGDVLPGFQCRLSDIFAAL